jgi:hypothetical protein
VVAVLAPRDSRLADEIRRELESSKFEVLSADLGARPWQDVARVVDGGRLLRGVAVEPNDRTLTVYTRQLGASTVDARLVLSVEPADRMARRHACLSVVEFLHALGENEPAVATDAGHNAPGSRAATPASGKTEATAARPNGNASTAAAPAAVAPALSSAAGVGSTTESAVAPLPAAREGAWQLGAGTTFDLETGPGEPTSHLQFLARIPLTRHVALSARMLWPLLAAQYRNSDSDVRSWTFSGGVSLQYTFVSQRRLQPFLGLALGTRLGLSETTPLTGSQSAETLTTSGTFGIEAGVRYPLGPVLQIFFQVEASRNWLLPPDSDAGVEGTAANGETARAAIGILFDS